MGRRLELKTTRFELHKFGQRVAGLFIAQNLDTW